MAIVIVLDQRGSSSGPDLVGAFSHTLNDSFEGSLQRPFVRTAGDEMQAILSAAEPLPSILAIAFGTGSWWIGIGLGTLRRTGDSARESAGPAFNAARTAIEAAKRARGTTGAVAVRGEPADVAAALNAAAVAMGFITQKRTKRQTEIVRTVQQAGTQREAAARMGITPQAVSDALIAAGYEPEQLLSGLILDLAEKVVDA